MPSSLPSDDASTKAVDTFGIGMYDSFADGEGHGEDDESREPAGASLPDGGPADGFDVDFFLSYPQEQALGPKHASSHESCPSCGYSMSQAGECLACNFVAMLPGDADRPPKGARPADTTLNALGGPASDVRTSESELPSDEGNPVARSDYYDRMVSGSSKVSLDEGRFWPSEDSGAYVTQEEKDPYEVEPSDEPSIPYKTKDGHYVDDNGEIESCPEPEFNTKAIDNNLQSLGNAWSGYTIQDDATPEGFPSTDFTEEADFLDSNPNSPEVWHLQPFGNTASNRNGDSRMQRIATNIELVRDLTKEFMKEYGKTNIVKRSVLAFLQSKSLPQYLSSDIIRCMKHDHKIVIPDVLDTFPLSENASENVRRLASVHEKLVDLSIDSIRNPEVSSTLRRCAADMAQAIAKIERIIPSPSANQLKSSVR